jgi:hypothetical protein
VEVSGVLVVLVVLMVRFEGEEYFFTLQEGWQWRFRRFWRLFLRGGLFFHVEIHAVE